MSRIFGILVLTIIWRGSCCEQDLMQRVVISGNTFNYFSVGGDAWRDIKLSQIDEIHEYFNKIKVKYGDQVGVNEIEIYFEKENINNAMILIDKERLNFAFQLTIVDINTMQMEKKGKCRKGIRYISFVDENWYGVEFDVNNAGDDCSIGNVFSSSRHVRVSQEKHILEKIKLADLKKAIEWATEGCFKGETLHKL